MGDYYEILGVAGDATADDIKKAYRRLALQWHPDKNPNNIEEASQKFKRIAEAYEILSDPSRRHAYDTRGQTPTPREHTTQPHFGSQDFRSAAEIFEFHFRPAEEIFRDFFRDNPFQDFFEQSMPPFFAFPPGLESLAASAFSGLRDYETSDRRRRNGQGTRSPRADRSRGTNRGHFTAMSASTKIINGKSVTTRREVENGVETTSVYEDGVLRSRTVRGPNQSKSSLRGPI